MPVSRNKGYQPKKRNTKNRRRNSVLLLATEGKNKTETLYLNNFRSGGMKIKYAPGNCTDPENMVKSLIAEYMELELDAEIGDIAFCLVDADISLEKDAQIAAADRLAENINAQVIVSNPCFEIWFLCHFAYSTKQYSSNEEVIRKLKEYIPDYTKNSNNIYEKISEHTYTAIDYAKRLEQHC